MRIAHIEDAAFAIAEAAYEERLVVRAQADVHGQHAFFTADVANFLRLPFAIGVFLNQPELRGKAAAVNA
jgi:hypothetical protein